MKTLFDPGQGESLEAFLTRMRPRLKQLLKNCRVPPEDAEDVLQDTFLALFRQWESIRHKESWLISTLRFKCAAYWKRVQDERLVAMDAQAVESFSQPRAPDQGREVPLWDFKTAVCRVGRKDKALLWLHFGMGLSLNEVAERLGYRPSGIRKLKLRAVARLEKKLSRWPQEPIRPNNHTDEAGGTKSPGRVPSGARQPPAQAHRRSLDERKAGPRACHQIGDGAPGDQSEGSRKTARLHSGKHRADAR